MLEGNTTGQQNVAIGSFALDAGTDADSNVAIGYQALSASSVNNNVAVGHSKHEEQHWWTNTAVGDAALKNGTGFIQLTWLLDTLLVKVILATALLPLVFMLAEQNYSR